MGTIVGVLAYSISRHSEQQRSTEGHDQRFYLSQERTSFEDPMSSDKKKYATEKYCLHNLTCVSDVSNDVLAQNQLLEREN